jgi:hypothetical protein
MHYKPLTWLTVAIRAARLFLLFTFALLLIIGGLADGASAQSAGETASAKTPKIKNLTVSPKKLSFGKLPPNQASAAKAVTIRNPNSSAVDVTSIDSSDTEFVTSSSCVGSLAADGNCEISVVFTPSSDGRKSGKLKIADSVSTRELSVNMTGAGKGTPVGTPSATPTPTPTPASCPTPSPAACASPGAPAITSLAPSFAVAGARSVPLEVCGCNLTASTAIRWNGVGQTTVFVSSNQVNATIPATDVAHVGVDQVTVSANSEVSAPQTFFVGNTGGAGYAELKVDQQSNDLVNDPVNQVIYLSVPGVATSNSNTISVLNLASGQISMSQFAGSEPDALAISDDSQYLYAGIDGAATVQRFTLPGLAEDISYSLGRNSFFGPYYAIDLQVAPGAPHTTAVSLGNTDVSPSAEGGVVIFDDSTPRQTTALGWDGGDALYDSIQWGADGTALYAANNEDTGFDFYVLAVDSDGVTLADDYTNSFSGFGARIHFDSGTGLVYSDDGHIVDPSTGNPVGEYSVPVSVMVPDSTLDRAFFVSESSGAATIEAFDLERFSLIGSVTIPNVPNSPLRIIRWGNNGLAFNTDGGPVYLIGGNFVH